jgi:cytochrome c oxidase subunit 2
MFVHRFAPLRLFLLGAMSALSALVALTPGPSGPAWAAAAGDPAKGKALYAKTCVACHGDQAQGKRELNSPALHAQEPWYIQAQLQKFRAGQRGADPKDTSGSLMRPMAKALPDEQSLVDLAAYISAIEGPVASNEVKGDVAAGAATYKKICASCHGENAKGKPDVKSPALVGQNDWYVVMQLQKFKLGQRGTDPKDVSGAQMRAIAATLQTDQDIKNVAAYLATVK